MRQNAYAIARICRLSYIGVMDKATIVFAALSDPIRLRSLALVSEHGELCVCELVGALALPQPKVSRHLATLRDAGLLKDRRDAQWVLYAISPDLPKWVATVIKAAVMAVKDDAAYINDAKRLRRTQRPARSRCSKAA